MTAARSKTRDNTAAGHAIEHRVFFGHPQRSKVERRQIPENDNLTVLGPLAERGSEKVRRRHQPVDVLMMLIEHDAIEPQLIGIGEFVQIFLVKANGLLAIE